MFSKQVTDTKKIQGLAATEFETTYVQEQRNTEESFEFYC
jgi:hypothetical protein